MQVHTKAVTAGFLLLLMSAGIAIAQDDTKTAAPTAKDTPAAASASAPETPSAAPEPASQPTVDNDPKMPPEVPESGSEAVDAGKQLIELGKAKKWFAMSAGIIWLLLFLLKIGRKKLEFLKGMKRKWLYIIVGVLSIAAMVLAKLQEDLSWGAAVGVLFSGPAVAFLNDFIKRGLLGKEPTTNGDG